jgi:outer membrane protein assembly factor BamB
MRTLLCLLLAATAAAQDYPQWRGQNRDGAASAFVEPKLWPEHLTRRWKVEVGEGYATPIVIGKTVYAFTRRDGKETMIALNAATGKTQWQTGYSAPYKMGEPTKAHGEGPKSTPLFYNGKLFTLGIAGIVTAFDAVTGRIVWQKPGPAEQPFFGTALSPVGEAGMVILQVGDEGPMTAFDASTGNVKWSWSGDGPTFGSPIVVPLDGVRQVVSMTQNNVVGIAVANGKLLWKFPWAAKGTPSAMTPIVYNGTIIVSSHNSGVKAFAPPGKLVWETNEVSLFMSNPVLIGDTLYGLSHKANGQYFALDAKTGKVLWLGPPKQAANTAVVKAAKLLFLLNDNGQLAIARANPEKLEIITQYTVADSATWAQPAITGNHLFIKDINSIALWTLN